MEELIPVSKREFSQGYELSVNGRELHSFLGVTTRVSTWAPRRVEEAQFTEGQDFIVLHNSVQNLQGGRPTIEYYFTLDAAKHLCMLERTEKGKEARNYFIAVEKEARRVFLGQAPSTFQVSRIGPMTQDAAMFTNGLMRIYYELDVPRHFAVTETRRQLEKHYSFLDLDATKHVPCLLNVPKTEMMLEPTAIGKKFLGVSGKSVNKFLHQIGWQTPITGGWEATEQGKPFCSPHAVDTKNFHTYNLAWRSEVVVQAWKNNPEIARGCLAKRLKGKLPPITEV